MPPGQLVHEPPAPASDPKSESTGEEDDREEEERLESICDFSEYGPSEDEEQPRGVYEVTPKLDSGT
jgi:hypothetical protein